MERKKWPDMERKKWADLSDGQKAGVIILGAVQVGLLIAALWDLAHRTPDEVRGSRRLWAGLVFINWIGPIAYFTFGRKYSGCCCCGATDEPPA